jgi:DNA primase
VVLNFDPDQAGANAAEKTIALLVEEGFEVRVVTLEGGLDPDRYIKERGMAAYSEAVRGAARYADYLIERARTLFQARTPESKVKALNMLLPHIRRVPNPIARSDFAENAAQKLGIESSLMRQELRQAAAQRLESVRAAQPRAVTEVERILLCVLVLPEADSARQLAAERLGANPEWFAELGSAAVMEVLVSGPAPENPFEAAPDEGSRALLASALHGGGEEDLATKVEGALDSLHDKYLERRLRELRVQMAEAQRRGDEAMLMRLAQEKLRVDKELKR